MVFLHLSSGVSVAAEGVDQPAGGAVDEPFFLLQTDIIGSVMSPSVSYQIPWKNPESIEQGDIWVTRSGIHDLFIPLEPESFERAMGFKRSLKTYFPFDRPLTLPSTREEK